MKFNDIINYKYKKSHRKANFSTYAGQVGKILNNTAITQSKFASKSIYKFNFYLTRVD